MTASQRQPRWIGIALIVILNVIVTWHAPSAFSATQPCEVFTPPNFDKLSLDKKIKVSEVVRECERRLKESHTKDVASPQRDTKAVGYITARANGRGY